jgi:hypothetical protein
VPQPGPLQAAGGSAQLRGPFLSNVLGDVVYVAGKSALQAVSTVQAGLVGPWVVAEHADDLRDCA